MVNCTYPGGKCLAILDMGTTYPIDSKTAQSIKDINEEIRGNNNRVQCVLISHLDSDHCNLFEKLSNLYVLEKVIVGGTGKGLEITDYSRYSLFGQDKKDKHILYLARSLKTRKSFLSIWDKIKDFLLPYDTKKF